MLWCQMTHLIGNRPTMRYFKYHVGTCKYHGIWKWWSCGFTMILLFRSVSSDIFLISSKWNHCHSNECFSLSLVAFCVLYGCVIVHLCSCFVLNFPSGVQEYLSRWTGTSSEPFCVWTHIPDPHVATNAEGKLAQY